ncbi:MAG: hypothetical protein IT232_03790 [Flavobacteriales bacterium]|nr:hypothetical protein [Flavobacteriales bacterium]
MVKDEIHNKQKVHVSPGAFTITLLSNGIIEVDWNADIGEIQLSHMKEIVEIVKEFGNGKKMPIYVTTLPFLQITIEAKQYVATEESQKYTLANAVLIDNLAKKLLFTFFININKPITPTKAFKSREDAHKWLLNLKKESK